MRSATDLRAVAVVGLALTVTLLLGPLTGTAAADPARPGNYEATADGVRPDVDGVRVDVLGGDAFLQVRAERGTEVLVPGYDGEPYLRIRSDGVVEENRRSPSLYLNGSKDGSTPLPPQADATAEPDWRATGAVGGVAWHDHRVHWMLDEPPTPGADGFVQSWAVPLVVDGAAVEARGDLRYRPDDWLAGVLSLLVGAAAVAGGLAVARRERTRVLTLGAAALGALVLSWLELRVNPPDAGASLLPLVMCSLALVLVALAPAFPRPWVTLAVVSILGGWGLLRLPVLIEPVLPTPLPAFVDRFGTAAVLGVAIGIAVAALRGPLPVDPDDAVTPTTPTPHPEL